MCTIAYGNRRGSSWEAREKYTFRGVHVSRSSSIHHPCIAFERHLLEGSDQASLIPRRGLSWRLRGGDRRVSLRRGAQNALTAALELCAIAATLRTLESSPWVDADPRTARVRCARRLLLLAAVGASAPPATLLLLTALLRWALLLLLGWSLLRGGGRR